MRKHTTKILLSILLMFVNKFFFNILKRILFKVYRFIFYLFCGHSDLTVTKIIWDILFPIVNRVKSIFTAYLSFYQINKNCVFSHIKKVYLNYKSCLKCCRYKYLLWIIIGYRQCIIVIFFLWQKINYPIWQHNNTQTNIYFLSNL